MNTDRSTEHTLPQRKKLPHQSPAWVAPGSRFFITINSLPRGEDRLCKEGVAAALLDGVRAYHEKGTWHARLALVMPDHLHAVLSFNPAKPMKAIIASWKGYQAKQHGIEWQADFFDHRLRTDEETAETLAYIRQNPVRKGLVSRSEDWPYVWPR
jgi:REP element-mobilizing transposase RayT